ncbi:MAG: hypothetical protein QXF69_06000 [Thermofilaceae archaeon]
MNYTVEKVTWKNVKVSEETYSELSKVAGELQARFKRPVSLDEALRYLLSLRKRRRRLKITDLAGSWDMSEEEWVEIKASLERAWKRWVPGGA